MTIKVSRLVPGSQLTNANVTYYTTPANTSAVVKRAVFCNTTGTAATITVNVVPSAGAVSAANEVIAALSIAAGVTYVSPELAGMTLGPGDTIQAQSGTGAAITFIASGITVV